ncbi:MAG: SH3 domain-containing protein [Clostridiales bacterium]|jgi:cell wall-associated NlpC family hydrolase|nr:SH3 domain-containing protein [Eubacteriales bacterium]MDH7566661.1 SH3 domain-containing protein [Clostridiales bacterium]
MSNLKKVLVSTVVCVLFITLFSTLAYAEGSQTGVITGKVVNLRQSPNTSSKVLDQLEKGSQVTVLKKSNDWYQVKHSGITGWVSGEYLSVKNSVIGTGTVIVNCANVRSQSSTSSDVVLQLSKGAKVSIRSRTGDWYRITTANGTEGWINKDLISVKDSSVSRGDEEQVSAEELAAAAKDEGNATTKGEKIVNFAKKYIGVKYVWGGTTPKGFDCSGFVGYVYKNFGISLNRVAADQAKQGTKVNKSDLKPGDLVFFDTNGGMNSISHVGIYIGGGKFIHASSSRSVHKVTISEINSGYYSQTFMTARRFIK